MPCPGGCRPGGSRCPSALSKEPGARAGDRMQPGGGCRLHVQAGVARVKTSQGSRPHNRLPLGSHGKKPWAESSPGQARNSAEPLVASLLVGTFRKTEGQLVRHQAARAARWVSDASTLPGDVEGWLAGEPAGWGPGQAAPSGLLGTCTRTGFSQQRRLPLLYNVSGNIRVPGWSPTSHVSCV